MMDDQNSVSQETTATGAEVSTSESPADQMQTQQQPTDDQQIQESQTQEAESDSEQDGEKYSTDSEASEPDSVPYSRFREIYYKSKQAERELEQIRTQQAQQEQQPQAPENKPKLEDFDYDEGRFTEALVDWSMSQRDQQAQVQAQQAEVQKKVEGFRQKQTDYQLNNADYQQLCDIADRTGVQFQPHVAEMIFSSDKGLELHHHLLANPEILERVNSVDQVSALRELVNLEGKFKAPAKKQTQAPPPIQPVQGGGVDTAKSREQLGKMSPQEYYAHMMAQRKAKGEFGKR